LLANIPLAFVDESSRSAVVDPPGESLTTDASGVVGPVDPGETVTENVSVDVNAFKSGDWVVLSRSPQECDLGTETETEGEA